MVAAHHIAVNLCGGNLVRDALGNQEVVDAPSGVVRTGVEHVAPPAVCAGRIRMQIAERIHKAGSKQLRHRGALLRGETGIILVCFRVLEVNLFVCDVQIATDDHRFLLVELLEVHAEVFFPAEPVLQAREFALTVGRVAGNHVEVLIFQRDQPALVIMQLAAHAVGNGERLMLRQNRRAGIALFLGRVKVLMITLCGNLRLAGLHFRLLQAEVICILRSKVVAKALAKTSAQAIDVPGNQLHRFLHWNIAVVFSSLYRISPMVEKRKLMMLYLIALAYWMLCVRIRVQIEVFLINWQAGATFSASILGVHIRRDYVLIRGERPFSLRFKLCGRKQKAKKESSMSRFISRLAKHILLDSLRNGRFERIKLRLALGDACETAIASGAAHALLSALFACMGGLRGCDLCVAPDFKADRLCMHAVGLFSCQPGDIMLAALKATRG